MKKIVPPSAGKNGKSAAPQRKDGFFGGALKRICEWFVIAPAAPAKSNGGSPKERPGTKLVSERFVRHYWELIERAHRQQEKILFLTSVFESTSDAVVIANPAGLITMYNTGAADIFGVDPEAALGYDLFRLLNDRLKPDVGLPDGGRFHRRMLDRDRSIRNRRVELVGKLDKVTPALLTVNFIEDAARRPLGIVAILKDNSEAERDKDVDALTGLYNRRCYDRKIREEYERLKRGLAGPISLLVIDLDDFKTVNDRYGHQAGDSLLAGVGDVLRAGVRFIDTACRYGGEEFAVILPATDQEGARQIAERIRRRISEIRLPVENGQDLAVTVSIGAATHGDGSGDCQLLYRQADDALYEAKRGGRNRTVVSGQARSAHRGPFPVPGRSETSDQGEQAVLIKADSSTPSE